MKNCNVCNETKELTEFYSNGLWKGKKKYKPSCKSCEYEKDMLRYMKIVKNFYGSLSCKLCGYDKNFAALDLHHVDPSAKEHQVSVMRNHSEEVIIKELEKCILICSNCHRELHFTDWGEKLKRMGCE